MENSNITKLVKQTELNAIKFLTKLIPVKINDENPYNGVKHSVVDVDLISNNLGYFYSWTSSQMEESLNYFKAKNK